MLLKDKQLAIAGGGPGGLMLARLLQQQGVNVRVYERDRDATVRQQGATLDLHQDSGLLALAAGGLLDEFKKRYRPGADHLRIVDVEGHIRFDEEVRGSGDDFNDPHFRPEIDRGPLRDLLIASLQPGTIVWDRPFQRMKREGEGWRLHFANGASAYADIVIGADGANSKVRSYVTDIRPLYSGITVVEGNIYKASENAPQLYELTAGGKVFALGHGQSVILSAKGEGSLSFYTGELVPEDWVKTCGIDFTKKEELLAWFKRSFKGWNPLWHPLFESDESYFIPRPMYHFPPDQRWPAHSNLTLLGDAAHRMPPYAGEGANLALLDALDLAEDLTSTAYPTIQHAIAHYQQRMLHRASTTTLETLTQTQALHNKNALYYILTTFNQMK